jgi:hypothetical protein
VSINVLKYKILNPMRIRPWTHVILEIIHDRGTRNDGICNKQRQQLRTNDGINYGSIAGCCHLKLTRHKLRANTHLTQTNDSWPVVGSKWKHISVSIAIYKG